MSDNTGRPNYGYLALFAFLIAFAPLLLIAFGPAAMIIGTLKGEVHPGYITAAAVVSAIIMLSILYVFFAFFPQFLVTIFGFGLYGFYGYVLGRDEVWKIVLAIGVGIVGSVIFALIGRAIKAWRSPVEYEYAD